MFRVNSTVFGVCEFRYAIWIFKWV